MRYSRSLATAFLIPVALAVTACSGSATDAGTTESSVQPAASTAVADTADSGTAGSNDGSGMLTLSAEQVAKVLTPTPTFVVTSDTAVEFSFPSGSHTDDKAMSHCQIGASAIGMEYEVTMTYPDGSLRCADLFN